MGQMIGGLKSKDASADSGDEQSFGKKLFSGLGEGLDKGLQQRQQDQAMMNRSGGMAPQQIQQTQLDPSLMQGQNLADVYNKARPRQFSGPFFG